jgi:hypothetical protein
MPDAAIEVSTELDVRRAQAEVFAFLVDTESFRQVDEALVDYGPVGQLAPGMSGWFKHRRGVMTARTTWTVTDFEVPSRVVVAIKGMGYAMTETARLEATPGGTHVTFVDRVWPTSLPGRLLVALSGGIMRRDLAKRARLMQAVLQRGALPGQRG